MWVPKTETEIVESVTSQTLEETSIFDVKREVSSKNEDVAKDVAAMANDGGVIVYGIGEDENRRPTVLNPVPLKGLRERISLIVQTAISEPPIVQIHEIPTTDDPSKGYLVVVVTQSERAPHMVNVKGNHRFYGRTATGNYPLNEGEVARLYERRQRSAVDQNNLLSERVKSAPLEPNPNFAYLHLFVRPLARVEQLLENTVKTGEAMERVLYDATDLVVKSGIYPSRHFPDFYSRSQWSLQPDGFVTKLWWPENVVTPDAPGNTLFLEVGFDGSGYLFCGRAAERKQSRYIFLPTVVAGNTVNFLAFFGHIFDKANYIGMVDLGIAIVGLKGSVLGESYYEILRYKVEPYDHDEYRRTLRISALELTESPVEVAKKLTMRLFNTFSQGHLEPFPKVNH